MASYRFCRPDDIPYLVRAVNECFDCHFPGQPKLTLDRFRSEMKSLDVWPSNSMVASSGAGPVAVMIATKRDEEVLITRVGVRGDHLLRGHASHLVMSLRHKLAVLGPERILVEAPESISHSETFFRTIGFENEATLTDQHGHLTERANENPFAQLIGPTEVSELIDDELYESARARHGFPWQRDRQTMLNSEDGFEALMLASPVRIEAFVVFQNIGDCCELLVAAAWPSPRRVDFLEALIRRAASHRRELYLAKMVEGELDAELCRRLSFTPGERFSRMAAEAVPS